MGPGCGPGEKLLLAGGRSGLPVIAMKNAVIANQCVHWLAMTARTYKHQFCRAAYEGGGLKVGDADTYCIYYTKTVFFIVMRWYFVTLCSHFVAFEFLMSMLR